MKIVKRNCETVQKADQKVDQDVRLIKKIPFSSV